MLKAAIGIVLYAEPFTHVYGVQETIELDDKPTYTAIALGSYGNSISGVQIQHAYNPGDTVIFIYEDSFLDPRTHIAYIVANAPTNTQLEKRIEDYVSASAWDGGNLSALNLGVFSALRTILSRPDLQIRINAGHGSKDMLPGDHEAAGELVSEIIGDYLAGFRSNCAEILVSGIDRRLILHSLLRTESTISSSNDIAIVGRSTIRTNKSVGNIDQAFYNQVQETDAGITPKNNPVDPVYRNVSIYGDVIYGKHKATLSYDGKSVLYKDFEANDGSKTMLSAKGFRIGRVGGLTTTEYHGERLNTNQYDPEPDTTSIEYPIPGIVAGDDWGLIGNDDLLGGNIYPEDFVAENATGFADLSKIEIDDPQLPGEKLEITPGKSDIHFRDDGSILITDAWGSYLLMSHGNIEIHARNNLFTVASRDHLAFAGGTKVDFAERNIEQQANNGSIKILAGDRLALQSENNTVIESKQKLNLIAKETSLDSLNITVTCRDTDVPGSVSGKGSFKLLVPDGSVNISADNNTIFGTSSVALVTKDKTALGLGSTVKMNGNLELNGGLTVFRNETEYTLVDPKSGELIANNIAYGNGLSIVNTVGDIRAEGFITSNKGVTANGQISGKAICKQNAGREEHLGRCGDVSQSTKISATAANVTVKNTGAASEPTDIEDVTFKFDTVSKACQYQLPPHATKGGSDSFENDGYKDKNNNPSYIYPGDGFWTGDGICIDGTKELYGFEDLPAAKPNDQKKGS